MAKGIMYIDGQRVPFDGEKNVLAVIRKAGIDMPTFCYYSELSTFGACRMCVVEDEKGKIDPVKLRPITFDPVHNDYLVLGEKVGNAFKDGSILKK